jgi:four helix bundle suffix protein
VDRFSRTKDQMVQAARSGVQNIAEGSQASATSKKTELKLTQVARASLEELKLDYQDFLRQRGLKEWERDHPLRQALIDERCGTADAVAQWIVRQVKARGGSVQGGGGRGASVGGGQGGRSGHSGQGGQGGSVPGGQGGPSGRSGPDAASTKSTKSTTSTPSTKSTKSTKSTASTKSTGSTGSKPSAAHDAAFPEFSANAALVLITVACSLLDRQVASLAKSFEEEGGFTERMYRVRSTHRRNARPE